jgi:predicted PurR-regulated permease PerM
MLGNLAISVICATVYGVTALILGVPYPLALGVIAGILDLIPNVGATIAGIIIAIAALSVSLKTTTVFVIVMAVYQQIENYILQPTIIGKAAQVSGFTVLFSVLAFGALFGLIGATIGVPIAAAIQIVAEELTAGRRARIAAADAADQQQPGKRLAQNHSGRSSTSAALAVRPISPSPGEPGAHAFRMMPVSVTNLTR